MNQPVILLREDDDLTYELISECVSKTLENCRIVRVQNWSEISEQLKFAECKMLISDLYGPGGYGVNIIGELRGYNSNLPVLVISGNIQEKEKSELDALAIPYFRKPFKLHQLSEYLENLFSV